MKAVARPLHLFLCLALVACAAPGTSAEQPSPTPAASEPTGLRFAIFGGGGAHLDWMVAETRAYDEAHDAVTVEVTQDTFYGPEIPYPKLQERYFEEDPDLVSGFIGGSLRPDAEAGRFLDLTDLWEELGLEDAVPASVAELASVDGRRYWIPTLAQWNPVFYNTDAFATAGLEVPTSWDGLLAACATLRGAGVEQPIAQSGGEDWRPPAARWFSAINLAVNGPELHEQLALGRVAWTDERVRSVFTYWRQLVDAGCYHEPVPQAYSDAIGRLSDGRAAMLNLGEWIYESALLADDDPVDFFRPPPIDPDLPRSDIVLVYGLAIPADADHPEEARELLRQLVSREALQRGYQTVPRVVLDRRVQPGYLPRHEKGLELFEGADHLVELWEFAATSPQADIGLELFTGYLADPDALEALLAAAEDARSEAYGAPGG